VFLARTKSGHSPGRTRLPFRQRKAASSVAQTSSPVRHLGPARFTVQLHKESDPVAQGRQFSRPGLPVYVPCQSSSTVHSQVTKSICSSKHKATDSVTEASRPRSLPGPARVTVPVVPGIRSSSARPPVQSPRLPDFSLPVPARFTAQLHKVSVSVAQGRQFSHRGVQSAFLARLGSGHSPSRTRHPFQQRKAASSVA
jgi:hypothetical protein